MIQAILHTRERDRQRETDRERQTDREREKVKQGFKREIGKQERQRDGQIEKEKK